MYGDLLVVRALDGGVRVSQGFQVGGLSGGVEA